MGHILVLRDYSSSFFSELFSAEAESVYGCQANKDLANVTRSRTGTGVLLGAVIVSIGAGDDGDRTGGLGVAALMITAVLAVTSKGMIRTGFDFLISSTTGGSSVGSYCAAESTTLIDMVTANEAD